MPFFKEVNTKKIVYRKFEINSEVIDGILEPINESENFILVLHIPNTNWSYDVRIIKSGPINEIYEEYIKLNKENLDKIPSVFYTILSANDYKTYLEQNNYREVKLENNIVSNIKPININIENKESNIIKNIKAINLVRDSEPLVYRYKSPGEK